MRTRRTLAVAAMVGALIAGDAAAAQASPWEFAGSYPTQSECTDAGDNGVTAGSWEAYKCILFEGLFDLYVR